MKLLGGVEMATTLIVYIVYGFILYSVYCFGMGLKMKNVEMIYSTASTIRCLFFIKSSILLIQSYLLKGNLESIQVVIYSLDTLFVFIYTHFVHTSLESPIVFMKKRNKLLK
jgi:hypothetical protein